MADSILTKGPNFNPTPKDRFRTGKDAPMKHHALLESDDLQRALDHAEMECARIWALQIQETAHAMATGYKLQGMREFITVFRMLAESPTVPAVIHSDNLSHQR